jgi:hypothetical protein
MPKTNAISVRLSEATYMEVANLAKEHQMPISTVVSALTTHSINLILDNNVQPQELQRKS